MIPFLDSLRLPDYARWWWAEVRAMTPGALTGWFAGDAAQTDILVDAGGLHRVRLEQGRARVIDSIATDALGTSPVLRDMLAREQDRVRLILSAAQFLTRELTLPAVVEENLDEAIGFEIDRVTPFKADQVHFAARVIGRDAPHETIQVLLVVVPRARMAPLLAAAQGAGLTVTEFVPEPAEVRGLQIDLMPAAMKPARKLDQRTRWNLGLLAAAAALALLAILLPVWQKREQVIALIPMLDKSSSEFALNRKVYDEYARLAGEYNHIAARKHAAQPVLAVIEEVSRISPDTTFTQNFELKSSGKVRELTMMGEAASASKVIESLEQSPLFQNASQRAQTTRGSQTNTERYHVATEVKPRAVPAAVLAEAIPPVVPAAPSAPPASAPATAPLTAPAPAAAPLTAPLTAPLAAPVADSRPVDNRPAPPVPAVPAAPATNLAPSATVPAPTKTEPGGNPVVPPTGRLPTMTMPGQPQLVPPTNAAQPVAPKNGKSTP